MKYTAGRTPLFIIAFLLLLVKNNEAYQFSHNVKNVNENTLAVEVNFKLGPKEIFYKDSYDISVNNPNVKFSDPITNDKSITFFDEIFGTDKQGYKNKVTFVFNVEKSTDQVNTVKIHNNFQISPHKEIQRSIIEVNFPTNKKEDQPQNPNNDKNVSDSRPSCPIVQPSLISGFIGNISIIISESVQRWKDVLSKLFLDTGLSKYVRFLIAFLLGILLSLTPCIYPMIPITVGVLQINQSKSTLRSFLIAASYTIGISTVFALFGFIAAVGSCFFGQLQGSPWTIIPLAFLLIYFGLSIFGFYEMYIPKFLQPKATNVKGGSFLSAFTFGAISGTVASPCLSPGLLLILDYVSNLSVSGSLFNYIEGFLLLFIFGIGSSLPLLIIGTFSGSANLMPKAGSWMVEIKKILGLMLIAMAFYHLSHLEKYIPWYILVWIIVAALFALGVYYFYSIQSFDSKNIKRYKNVMGFLLIILSALMALQGYKAFYNRFYQPDLKEEVSIWLESFEQAKSKAINENKFIFLDIGATYCSACSYLDKKIFKDSNVLSVLANNYVPLKIEYDINEQEFKKIDQMFTGTIKGFPTYLVIDPKENKIIKKWSSEIGDLNLCDVIKNLENISSN